jgi:outer membrane protein OmpA-like peptidoglycan-associated protein
MKCNPWRWLWGLVPVVVLAWACVQVEHLRIEQDLGVRAKQALAGGGFDWADVSLSGRDAVLSGKASDKGDAVRAAKAVSDTWGVRTTADVSTLIDVVDRYEWMALRRDNRVRLTGSVPSAATRRDIIGIVTASFPNLEIDDRLKLARGAPPIDTWMGGVGFGIKQLAQLKRGQVQLDVTAMTISGEALDVQAYRNVKAALSSALPPGISLRGERITAPVVKPFHWSARLTRDQLVLSGFVPGDKLHEELVTAARRHAAPAVKVVDELDPAEGAPGDWASAVLAVVRALAGLEEGTADARDAQWVLAGIAETDAKAEQARRELQALTAPHKVTVHITTRERPPVSPYVTTASLDAGKLVLGGHAPTADEREALVDFAKRRLPGTQVEGALAIASGQAAAWRKCIEAGLDALAQLGGGRASLTDRRLEITGRTQSSALIKALPDAVRASAGADCDADVTVAFDPPPEPKLRWSANYDQDVLELSGEVAGEAAKTELLRVAGAQFSGARVADRMTPVGEPSEAWTSTAREALTMLAKLKRGKAEIVDQELSISGDARDDSALQAIGDALARGLPKGYGGRHAVVVHRDPAPAQVQPKAETMQSQQSPESSTASIESRPAPEVVQRKAEANACQVALQSVAKTGTIEFDRADADLDPASYPTLERLAAVAGQCPNVRFEVAGHADGDGREENNKRLSERRAQAVLDYLAKSGVPAVRMSAVGYGTTRPLVPNTTAENKAKNRRIEFVVKTD